MPRIVDHDARRTELAAAACEAIFRFGMHNLTLTDVGKVAGCTTGTITHYFANKDALLLAALEHAWGTIKQRMYTRLSQDEHDALGFFAELLPITSENRIAVVVWFHYWLRGLNSLPLAERRRANRIEWLQMLEKCLLGMQSRGEIVLNGEIDAEIQGVDAIINGIALQAILDPDEWPVTRQMAQLRCYFDRLRPFHQVKEREEI